MHPGLCAGPGLEAVAQLAQWAHVGTEVTCPPGRKAEAPPSASGFLVLIPEGRIPVTSAPLLACLPSSSHPCPWTLRDQDWPTCKIPYRHFRETFPTLGSDGLGYDSRPMNYNYGLGQVAGLPDLGSTSEDLV